MLLSHSADKDQAPARVVVLGAAGFLGRRLCDSLRAAGIGLLVPSSKDVDLTNAEAGARLAGLLREGDVVVFLAALTPDRGRDSATLMLNVTMARAVAAAAAKVKLAHLIYASSDAVYPLTTGLVSEEAPAAPVDLYGAMHRIREIILANEAPAPLALLRFTTIYGAGDTHNSYGPNRFIRQALKDGVIPLFGAGEEMRDHLYVEDAVAITRRVIARRSVGVLNVASGRSRSFMAVAEAVAALQPARIEPSPRKSPITHRHFDPTLLLSAFPELRLTAFADGLRTTVNQMKAA